ncbi:hypothetical protein [Streptomyces hygroscopicus]|uniref:hypothetical protein n=1 Tax=Streptomyces hygroscopicus TaxID=1912 RepID=UPI000A9C7B54|nr:hypothetical protein [Streptomyces hygroscopicus]
MGARGMRWGVGVLLVMAVAGCGSAAGEGDGDGTAAVAEPRLPLARYQPDDGDYGRYADARDRLARACMVRLGFDDFPLRAQLPGGSVRKATVTAVRAPTPYGLLDLADARRWGYGWEPGKKAADGRAMTDAEFDAMYTRAGGKAPAGGCAGQADRRVLRGVEDSTRMWNYADGRALTLEKAARQDPRVRRALRSWSQCLVDKGFKRYRTPDDAYQDTAWHRGEDGNTPHARREVSTAVADVECKREHDTVGVWSAVLAERQRADITAHRADYEAARRDLATLRANVRSALADR